MRIQMQSHCCEQRSPDWTAAVVSGFAAAAILMMLELLWSSFITGIRPWEISHMIAALVLGSEALESNNFNLMIVSIALVTHYVLGVVFALALAALIVPFRLDSSMGMVLLSGALFGIGLYLFNFYGMVRFFAWFTAMRGWPNLAMHVIFGSVTAAMYMELERTEK